jgi:hypothetical protein
MATWWNLVYTTDLKSVAPLKEHVGSNPTVATSCRSAGTGIQHGLRSRGE